MFKKRVRRRRGRIGKGSGIKKDGARREDYGEICAGVQKSGERKWIRREAAGGRIQMRDEWGNSEKVDGGGKPAGLH